MELFTSIAAVVGALAWLPFILSLRSANIRGKVMSYGLMLNTNHSYRIPFDDARKQVQGTSFYINMAIISERNSYPVSEIRAKVKFRNDSKIYDGHVFFADTVVLNEAPNKNYAIQSNNILFCPTLKMDAVYEKAVFIIAETTNTSVEFIEIIFYRTKKRKKQVRFNQNDFLNACEFFSVSPTVPTENKAIAGDVQ